MAAEETVTLPTVALMVNVFFVIEPTSTLPKLKEVGERASCPGASGGWRLELGVATWALMVRTKAEAIRMKTTAIECATQLEGGSLMTIF